MSGALDYVNQRVGTDSMIKGMTSIITAPFTAAGHALGINNLSKVNETPKSATEALTPQTKKQTNKKDDVMVNNITNYTRFMYAQNPGTSLGAGYLGL